MKRKQQQDGFTLIELGVVVAIIGILAVIATVGYRRMVTGSYMTEATRMVNAIRIAQESVRAETGSYVNVGTATMCPQRTNAPASGKKWGWDPTCDSGGVAWSNLPVAADGPVRFGYGTVANATAGQNVVVPAGIWNGQINGIAPEWPSPAPQSWYVIVAGGDMDGNGVFCHVIGSSFTNELWIDHDGE